MPSPPYSLACEAYASVGVDVEAALGTLAATPISLHCWQGDDVGGFERAGATLEGGGIQATGNYPGKARTIDELRSDLDAALALLPGRHRLNLHAIYGDFGGKKVERNAIGLEHFQGWIDWAKQRRLGVFGQNLLRRLERAIDIGDERRNLRHLGPRSSKEF